METRNDGHEPFPNRFGLVSGPEIDNDFPQQARIGLWHVLSRFVKAGQTSGWAAILDEVLRLRRVRIQYESDEAAELAAAHLAELDWDRVYIFCERVYSLLLESQEERDWNNEVILRVDIESVRTSFEMDINQLFGEEGIAYRMTSGLLHRPGRLHSQRVTAKALVVLRDPRLVDARTHFSKAQRFFRAAPEADYPNAVKEAVSAIESAVKALHPVKATEFEKRLAQLRDGTGSPIPATIQKSIASVYQYRGAGEGVAHGGTEGGKASAAVAEWVLSVAASSIIYLRDLASEQPDDAPPF